jgi:hypothetical protein
MECGQKENITIVVRAGLGLVKKILMHLIVIFRELGLMISGKIHNVIHI